MAENCHIQTGSCMLIWVPLNAGCQIVTAAPVGVTAGIASVTGEIERTEGTDYSAPNFGGANCGPDQRNETTEKWMNLSGNLCLVDWTFQSAASGNPTVVDGDDNVVGYASLTRRDVGVCSPVQKPKLAMVIVRRAATDDGACSTPTADTGATACVGHFFSNVGDWRFDMPPFEDSRASVPFMATAYANPRIGAGPLNLWPAAYVPNVVPPTSYHAQAFLDCSVLPSVACATVSHPAPAVRVPPEEE